MSRRARIAEARSYCHTLWGDRQGYVRVGVGIGGHFVGVAYKFNPWKAVVVRWPDAELPSFLVAQSEKHDVYTGVLLRSKPKGGAAYAQPGAHAWVDLDTQPQGDGEVLLAKLLADEDSFAVLSGGRGKRHVYVSLDTLTEPDEMEPLNRRLVNALGGDSGWSADKVLRPPGTLNHKTRRGRGSMPVVVEDP